MGNMKCVRRPKIVLVPYPAQGHVTPILKLASTITEHGFEPVLITPEFIHRRIVSSIGSGEGQLLCMPIPDGLETDTPPDFFAIEKAMENHMAIHLERLLSTFDGGVACMIVDLLFSPAFEVAQRLGVPVAGFWPAMLATYYLIAAIPEMVRTGIISDTGSPQQLGSIWLLPNQPRISTEDLPWLIGTPNARRARFKFWTKVLNRSRHLEWLIVNSFPEAEYIDADNCKRRKQNGGGGGNPLVIQAVPLNDSSQKNKPSLWEEDMSCPQWLDKQETGSVLYISFGSWVSPIGEAKIRRLALALEAMGRPFIWVLGLGAAWRDGLPVGYLERISSSKQGKVVAWAPQLEVLRHKAVGCYLTHCGWNSTMEAIQCQKRLLCYPVAGDQFLNCAYIVEKWRIGVKVNEGFVQGDIEECLRRVMEDGEMSSRLKKLYELAMGQEAKSKVQSNLKAFFNDLKKLTN